MDEEQQQLALLLGHLMGNLASAREHIRVLSGSQDKYPRTWGYYLGTRDTCRRLLAQMGVDPGDEEEDG